MQSYTALYFIKLYYIIIPATCFCPICRAIFRLIFREVECTINNAFNLLKRISIDIQKILRLPRITSPPNYSKRESQSLYTLHNHPVISILYGFNNLLYKVKGKGKAIPLQAWTGPESSRRLRLPDFKTFGT